MQNVKMKRGRRLLAALLSAAVLLPAGIIPVSAREADTGAEQIQVAADGAVAADSAYDGPQVKKVRLLKEGNFLEIYWDRYVDEKQAVNTGNFVLKNGTVTLTLKAKPADGNTDTLYFDKNNKEVAATEANSMARLSGDMHMSSICFVPGGSFDETKGFTLKMEGDAIRDESGKAAKNATYVDVPRVNFYTRFLTTGTGIVVKADSTVAPGSLGAAKAQIDVMLSKSAAVAQNLKKYGTSLAIYSPHENVYLIPEQRYGFNKNMYDVEGYGGNLANHCVSSIAERNILRTRGNTEDPDLNTAYKNENILVHEFGHAVKSVGMDLLGDQTVADRFYDAYQNAKDTGLWPNTYAITNADEFFATMGTVWFNVMQEADDWNDGVRCPINTRGELKKYDPKTYAFFASFYPEETLPAPWDKDVPDVYHEEYTKPPTNDDMVAAVNSNFASDIFRLQIHARGDEFEIDRYVNDSSKPENDMCLWTLWGTDGNSSENCAWIVTLKNGHYSFASPAGQKDSPEERTGGITAESAAQVGVGGHTPNPDDPAQQWNFVADTSTANAFDGRLVNVKYGTALSLAGGAMSGTPLKLAENGGSWTIRNTTQSAAIGKKAYLTPYVAAETVTLSQTTLALRKGHTAALTATVKPDNATDRTVTWSSSSTKVATVDAAGKVTAKSSGHAEIKAKTQNGKTAVCTVKVTGYAYGQDPK